MQIKDCTLCLLPKLCQPESRVELYKLLCSLPITVEYPAEMEVMLKTAGILKKNSKVLVAVPRQDEVSVPNFGENFEKQHRTFFPANDLGLASAIACCGLEAGGTVRTAFGGLANTAATEEVLLALFVTGKLQHGAELTLLPQITALFQKITGKHVPLHKPVIGNAIFEVESGIHVDGILKNPELYEPFAPETVGMKRKIVLGSHSGHTSVREKLKDFEIDCNEKMIEKLLTYVQTEGRRLKRHLTDEEFLTALGEGYAKRSSIC